MNRNTLYATAAFLTLAFAPVAFAQGGSVINQASSEYVTARFATHDTGSAAYPAFDGPVINLQNNQIVPAVGNEGIEQSANSLPQGAASLSLPAFQSPTQSNAMEAVVSGHLAPNNGSGIPQTYASMPVGAADGTVPEMQSRSTARYMAAKTQRDLAARNQRLAGSISAPHG